MDKSQPSLAMSYIYAPPSSPARHPPPHRRSSRNNSHQRRRTRRKVGREASVAAAATRIEKTDAENISAAKIVAAEAATEIPTTIDMTVQVDESDQAEQVPNLVNDAHSSDLDDHSQLNKLTFFPHRQSPII